MFNELEPKNIHSLGDVDVECAQKCKSWNVRSPNVLCRPPPLFSSLWLHSWFTFHWSFCFCASFWTICHWPSPFSPQLLKCCLADRLQLILYIDSVFSCDKKLHPFPSLADTCALKISVGRTSLAWTQLSYHPDFFLSQHCWEISLSRILPPKPLCTGNSQLILISFLQFQAVQEDLWVSISFSCISSSTYSSLALCVFIIISLQRGLIACLCRISPRDCKPREH